MRIRPDGEQHGESQPSDLALLVIQEKHHQREQCDREELRAERLGPRIGREHEQARHREGKRRRRAGFARCTPGDQRHDADDAELQQIEANRSERHEHSGEQRLRQPLVIDPDNIRCERVDIAKMEPMCL